MVFYFYAEREEMDGRKRLLERVRIALSACHPRIS